jgi:uncharacterized protein YjiS (DUF1127 family)
MYEFQSPISRPSAHEFHLRARREQAVAISSLARHAVNTFATWIARLAHNGASLARRLSAARRLHRDIRALRTLRDRELADMGLPRSEIEHQVRHGRAFAVDRHHIAESNGEQPERKRRTVRDAWRINR